MIKRVLATLAFAASFDILLTGGKYMRATDQLASEEFQLFLRLQEINRPKCPQCNGRMWLTRLEPGEPNYHKRTFECFRCERVTTEIISHNDTSPSSACEMLTRGLSERSGVFDLDLFRSLRGPIDKPHQR